MRNRPNLYGRLDVTFSGSSDRWRRRRRDRSGNRQRGDGRHRRSGNEGKDQRELKGIRGRFVSKEEPAKAFTYHSVSLVSVPVPAIRQCVSHSKLLFIGSAFFTLPAFCNILWHSCAFSTTYVQAVNFRLTRPPISNSCRSFPRETAFRFAS